MRSPDDAHFVEWDENPEPGRDPLQADSIENAIFINSLPTGNTMAVGRADSDEIIRVEDYEPVSLDEAQ